MKERIVQTAKAIVALLLFVTLGAFLVYVCTAIAEGAYAVGVTTSPPEWRVFAHIMARQ